MDKTAVTTASYNTCVMAGKCESLQKAQSERNYMRARAACVTAGKCDETYFTLTECNSGISGRENLPVNCFTLENAARYCAGQGHRLPTEQEVGHPIQVETDAGFRCASDLRTVAEIGAFLAERAAREDARSRSDNEHASRILNKRKTHLINEINRLESSLKELRNSLTQESTKPPAVALEKAYTAWEGCVSALEA